MGEFLLAHNIHMWFALLAALVSVFFFIREKVELEIISVGLLAALILFGQVFPLYDANGKNMLDTVNMLSGFANPSLLAVICLLVMGQAMIYTDALKIVTNVFELATAKTVWVSIFGIMFFVMCVSAFINNTPLVIIAIPLVQVLAHAAGRSESRMMIPLSYVAILGGMMTLIGSSTNLLVSSAMTELGYEALEFFQFVVPGSILAGVGFLYVLFILPRLLPDRRNMAQDLRGNDKEFVAEIDVTEDSKLVGMECVEGVFSELSKLNIRLIQRRGQIILPPFEGYTIEVGDIMIVSANRKTLTSALSQYSGFMLSGEEPGDSKEGTDGELKSEPRVLAEVMITPASRMVDMSLEHVSFQRQFGAIVLGIQRRARVVQRRLARIRLEAGDVLLVAGRRSLIDAMRNNPDFIVLSGSKRDLPPPGKAPVAALIFLVTIGSAAFGLIQIPAAAFIGAVAMVATGCLNIRQATRAIDRKIYLLVGAMLALGVALQVTGGARFVAELILQFPFADSPLAMLAILFLLVSFATNILTNNACAILFTPIALNLAGNVTVAPGLGVDIYFLFAITVIFAANCSFATPIGYQTNLLVMGPGHYRFRDFIKAGVPLILLLWVTYMAILKYYYGL